MPTKTDASPEPAPKKTRSVTNSGLRFPIYNLLSSIEVVKKIHEKGGGSAAGDQLASFLGYGSTNNGAYLSRIGAARVFQLIEKSGNAFVLTSLAKRLVSPVFPEDEKEAKIEAFLAVPLFNKVYDEFRGQQLPAEAGLKNALIRFGVVPSRVDFAYRALVESADTAGFFDARNGARSHLVKPTISNRSAAIATPAAQNTAEAAATPPPSGNLPPAASVTAEQSDAKAAYLAFLIKVLEQKSAKGDLDEKLMERIERLLGESTNAT